MFWESYCENIETDKLLSDKELIKFISPHNENVSKDEIIFPRLNNFENYIFKLYNEDKKLKLTIEDFTKIANEYFDNFKVEID